MNIDFNKPANELTALEYAWLLAWQASLIRGTTPAWAKRDADVALAPLEKRHG